MVHRRMLLLLACLSLLPGCLQIELGGPVTGARVTITPLQGGAPIVRGLVSTDVQKMEQDIGAAKWAGFSNAVKAAFLGVVELPEANFIDNAYYLVTATGGVDKDSDENGRVDRSGSRVERQVYAIMSGAQLKQPFNRVNMLSDAIYRVLEPELDQLTNPEIGKRLNELARRVLGDVNGDTLSNYKDVLQWSNFSGKKQYKGSSAFLARLPRAIRSTLYGEDIALSDSFNVVYSASFRPTAVAAPWRMSLVSCTFPVTYGDLCTMKTLPLMGIAESRPEVADIMARVVVSHPWITQRFEQILSNMPADILLLFRSVTAVVIGTEIRPSFYDPVTGALYLDAENFWLTKSERQTVSSESDYRAEFANAVNFADLWRYVDDGVDAFDSLYAADELGQRQLADIELNVASLLLHELAHATDAVRLGFVDLIPTNARLYQMEFTTISDDLQDFSPLESDALASMAGVLYSGVQPTSQEASYSASQIGKIFAPDRATDLYSYSSQFEDLAMLFEEAMMEILYGVQRDVAFTSIPKGEFADDFPCEEFRVAWGMRGRIAATQVLARTKLVVAAVLPDRDYSHQLDQLQKPVLLNSNKDWCESVQIDGDINAARYRSIRPTLAPRQWTARRYH